MIKNMVKVSIIGKMEESLLVLGLMVNKKVLGFIYKKIVNKKLENGNQEKE